MGFFELLAEKDFSEWKTVEVLYTDLRLTAEVRSLEEELELVARFNYDSTGERCGRATSVVSEKYMAITEHCRIGFFFSKDGKLLAVAMYDARDDMQDSSVVICVMGSVEDVA